MPGEEPSRLEIGGQPQQASQATPLRVQPSRLEIGGQPQLIVANNNITGAPGGSGGTPSATASYFGGSANGSFGSAARSPFSQGISGAGGASMFGRGGRDRYSTVADLSTSVAGNAASGFGSGGGGTFSFNGGNAQGGNGTAGIVYIFELV